MKRYLLISLIAIMFGSLHAFAQDAADMEEQETPPPTFSQPHGLCSKVFRLHITPSVEGRKIVYTTDGSEPNHTSSKYSSALYVTKTTVVRAAEVINDSTLSPVMTASYIFPEDVIKQATNSAGTPIIPAGYPERWGKFIDTYGYAPALYAMDRTIVDESKTQVLAGFNDLPIVSIVTARDNFFGSELDEEKGGIYIYTGAPIGDHAGRDWERKISVEIMGGDLNHDVTVDCGVKIHGGHSRVPEKNAKHAMRLMFKSKYGPSKLRYPVFGDEGASKYEDLILRTHHSNSWLHWSEGDRQRAQYTRDLWAKSIQERLGWPHSKGQMVHLFINGLYWGMYTLTERITSEHCAEHYGGKKSEYDVIKVDEMAGETVQAADGDLDAWNRMTQLVAKVRPISNSAYYALEGKDADGNPDPSIEPLLDIDNFIDYMLINYYAGNNDWDSHNWFAFRNKVNPGKGFQFMCWDCELIMVGKDDNVTTTNNVGKPTALLNTLIKNNAFRRRFNHRAHLLFTNGGLLTPDRAVEVWDSLYNVVRNAVYDESARWGTYRRDWHPYQSKGHRYRVDTYYMNERNRLLTDYFPQRTDVVIQQLKSLGWYTNADTYVTDIAATTVNTEPVVETARYNASGVRIAEPQPGINIVHYSNGTTRKEYVR